MKGKLKFKGSGGSSKSGGSKRTAPPVSLTETSAKDSAAGNKSEVIVDPDLDALLTDAQKRHIKKQRDAEAKEIEKAVKTSYRERIENFNAKLSTLTEHNDIPRVSAAGNG